MEHILVRGSQNVLACLSRHRISNLVIGFMRLSQVLFLNCSGYSSPVCSLLLPIILKIPQLTLSHRLSSGLRINQSSPEHQNAGANSPLNLKSRSQLTPLPPQWPPSDPVPFLSLPEPSAQPSAHQGPHQTTSSPHPHPPHQPKHTQLARTQHPPSLRMNSPTSPASPAPGGTQWAPPESCT